MEIDVKSPSGNAFAIMAITRNIMRDLGKESEINSVIATMAKGNYEELKAEATRATDGLITFYE